MTLLLDFYLLDVVVNYTFLKRERYPRCKQGVPWLFRGHGTPLNYLRATYFPHVQRLIHPPHHQLVYFAPRSRVAFATVPQRLESRIQR